MTEAKLNHPGDETLRALSLGQLTEVDLAQVSAHLDLEQARLDWV
jgi:hypothetical protein